MLNRLKSIQQSATEFLESWDSSPTAIPSFLLNTKYGLRLDLLDENTIDLSLSLPPPGLGDLPEAFVSSCKNESAFLYSSEDESHASEASEASDLVIIPHGLPIVPIHYRIVPSYKEYWKEAFLWDVNSPRRNSIDFDIIEYIYPTLAAKYQDWVECWDNAASCGICWDLGHPAVFGNVADEVLW